MQTYLQSAYLEDAKDIWNTSSVKPWFEHVTNQRLADCRISIQGFKK